MTTNTVTVALLGVLNASRSPPLTLLEQPHYLRELCPHSNADDSFTIEIDKRGYRRYKRRCKPKFPAYPVDIEGIKTALNVALNSTGLQITEVVDCGEYIKIIMKEGELKC